MISRSKYNIDDAALETLMNSAGIGGAMEIAPLGAGEYNAVFYVKADGKEYAVKIAPKDDTPVLTYERGMMASEVFWYEQISKHTAITVPKIYHADFSKKLIPADYFIMEKLPGQQMDNMNLSEAEKEHSASEIASMIAAIHSIKNDKFGYIQNGLYGDWYQAIRAMVNSLLYDCTRKRKRSKRGQKLLEYIDKYKTVLEQAECCMVNFDLWPSNIICRREDGSVGYAWIDPERSFWGDRIADFVCLETMAPFAAKKKSLSAYNSVADSPVKATSEEEVRYAVALAYLGLILETEKYFRYTIFHYGWWRNVTVSKVLLNKAFAVLKG